MSAATKSVQPKQRGMLFSGSMVRAIRDGRKTQTRRMIGSGVAAIYRLTDDLISAIHTDYDNIEQLGAAANPGIAERRLHGRKRWSDLLKDQICWIWAEGARGLVSAQGSSAAKGLPYRLALSRQQEDHKDRASPYLHGIPWDAGTQDATDATSRRGSQEQRTRESGVGDPVRELARSQSARAWLRGREASRSQAERLRAISSALGGLQGGLQPSRSGPKLRDVAIGDLNDLPWSVGQKLYVRETWCDISYPGERAAAYRATDDRDGWKWSPSIHMPKWAARTWLLITDVRVERVQQITPDGAIHEGATGWGSSENQRRIFDKSGKRRKTPLGPSVFDGTKRDIPYLVNAFAELWDSINAKRTGCSWSDNPWVWRISFERTDAPGCTS